MEVMRLHSKLGASSAKRWMSCPGSVSLIEKCPPKKESAFAQEGTAAHALAELVAKNNLIGKGGPNAFYYVGRESEVPGFLKEYKITEEMAEGVQEYVDHARNVLNSLNGGEVLVEHKFHLKHIHPDFFGTCDLVIMQAFGELHVFDFKFGAGIAVEVRLNEQMMFYALGALELGDFTKVVLHICQPRAEHPEGTIRSWSTTPDELINFGKILKTKAIATAYPDAPLSPGEHCRFCPAAAVCPALHTKAMEVAKTEFRDPVLPEPKMLTPEHLAKVMEFRKLIEKWFEQVEEHCLLELMAGRKIEGVKLVSKRSSREWIDAESVGRTLGETAYTKKLCSVAQAEKIFGKDRIVGLFQTIDGGVTVAHESDRRKPLTNAKDVFTKIETISAEDF